MVRSRGVGQGGNDEKWHPLCGAYNLHGHSHPHRKSLELDDLNTPD